MDATTTIESKATAVVDQIWSLLATGMEEVYIGEDISQLEHALQAANSAASAACDDETVLAALLHDIGQFVVAHDMQQQMLMTDESGNTVSVGAHGHEHIGGKYLRDLGFSDKVAQLVEAHVNVKRYLTGKDDQYYSSLSEASKSSLRFQGGPFNAAEVAQFEASDYFALKVQLRRWDDAAKVVGMVTPDLASYRSMAINHLIKQQSAAGLVQ
ncbi:hypothetical protein SAMD00019534_039340 [Acytostelium subglobosum LB1]|uniref:hypothetical protein n=1 Tax=Acytostelium subglobosum LB1 TaxID=1410327 RepID=UPI000645010C|nr:hypothetical protein SAMD00019534_039340 [Acytostelium subglobosum LB1]GAM20759.1 hypothetical protein SAMD00019534_039340 [Acytostelium subglobosum LB1]|eukprot:XP_012755893.1 hypothetical protein SAMD00019534_039340 [Acytostelium subglobosum LB1]